MEYFSSVLHETCVGFLCSDNMVILFCMYGRMDKSLVLSHVLHDVDLTIIRPLFDIFTKHPYRRPSSFTFRQFCSHLHTSVLERKCFFGNEFRRCVLVTFPLFFSGFYNKMAIFYPCIFLSVSGVKLQFIISESIATSFKSPFRFINLRSIDSSCQIITLLLFILLQDINNEIQVIAKIKFFIY